MAKKRFQRHFRKGHDKNIQGHPVYAFSENKKNYDVLVITHSKKTKNIKNVPLLKNPDPKDNRIAYIHPYPKKSNKKGRVLNNWKFEKSDQIVVDKIIEEKKGKGCGRK